MIAVVILLLLIAASIGLLSNRENKMGDAMPGEPEYSEMLSMAAIWAEALKTEINSYYLLIFDYNKTRLTIGRTAK